MTFQFQSALAASPVQRELSGERLYGARTTKLGFTPCPFMQVPACGKRFGSQRQGLSREETQASGEKTPPKVAEGIECGHSWRGPSGITFES